MMNRTKAISLMVAAMLTVPVMMPAMGACAEEQAGMPNPWTELEESVLAQDFSFNVPAGAEAVSCRRLDTLAEVTFTLDGAEYCFRMQATSEAADISGLYYDWEDDMTESVGVNAAAFHEATDGDTAVRLLTWYDVSSGTSYALSAMGGDLTAADLELIANEMYVSGQTDVGLSSLAELNGKTFTFCSGAGAWFTELTVGEDGSFTGSFHDSNLGEADEELYPSGTVYGCTFSGRFEQVGSSLRVAELEPDEGQVPEAIEDGVRYVTTQPYGLTIGAIFGVYAPGAAADSMCDEARVWFHLMGEDATALTGYGLYDAANEVGFAE